MNGFLRHLLSYRSDTDLLEIALGFKQVYEEQSVRIRLMELESARIQRDYLAMFLVALDKPEEEEELRANLHAALRDMSDQVARLEEHVR